MLGLISLRLLQAIPVLLVVGFIAFALFAYVGDPVTIMLGQDYSEAQRLELIRRLGLDQPFCVQYGRFLWTALHGDFGISYRLAQPVSSLL
ncbi:MAG TPA: ABC transporter permease, partial [Stellaceae bacterium]|nr:ABC transporter permease [Stellaceae bacterium]